MIPINLPSGNYFIVGVPEGARNILIKKNQLRWKINPLKFYWDLLSLPPGAYEIVGKGLCSEITEEEWKGVVERYFPDEQEYLPTAFWNYPQYKDNGPLYDATSTDSGHSLIQSHNQQPDRCVLVKQL